MVLLGPHTHIRGHTGEPAFVKHFHFTEQDTEAFIPSLTLLNTQNTEAAE